VDGVGQRAEHGGLVVEFDLHADDAGVDGGDGVG
jgi:hypothetical protein